MRVYLYLAQSGLVLGDLALRLYQGETPASVSGITMVALATGTDYMLDGVPAPGVEGATLTFETPAGVYHAHRLGVADTQPLHVILPIRQILADPLADLSVKLFVDGVEAADVDLEASAALAVDGEYSVSGWVSSPLGEQWALRWAYNGITYAHDWTGTTGATPFGLDPEPARGEMLEMERDMAARVIRNFGDGLVYTLRRKNSLRATLALTLAAAALAGATSISVTAAGGLKRNDGRAVAGATFTIAGIPGTYTVAADATVTGGPLALTFTPALAGPVAQGAALTWMQPYAEYDFEAMNGRQDVTEERMVASGELVRWLLYRDDAPAPAVGDELGTDGAMRAIQRADPIGSSGVSRYMCVVGAAS